MLQLLQIARNSMTVQESALQTATHNLANAERSGYARQRQIRVAEAARSTTGHIAGQVGMGVRVALTERVRDLFYDRQLRNELHDSGEWGKRAEVLEVIATITDDLGETGLQTVLSHWFDSLQELSKQPESAAVRSLVAQRGRELTGAVNALAQQLDAQVSEYEFQLEVKVQRVNELATAIADLGVKINRLRAGGQEPNDLLDQRDEMLDELASLVHYQAVDGQTGVEGLNDLRVMIEGRVLNTPGAAAPLALERGADGKLHIIWAVDGVEVQEPGGELAGIRDAAYEILPRYRAALDQFAVDFATAMNAAHSAGYDAYGNIGGDFFTGTNAMSFAISDAILADVSRIAASASGARGDGSQALVMAQIAQNPVIGGRTPGDYLNELTGNLAVETADAMRRQDLAEQAVQHYADLRQSVMGVSQDEEIADIIKYQKAYTAMARVINIADEMLEELVNLIRR